VGMSLDIWTRRDESRKESQGNGQRQSRIPGNDKRRRDYLDLKPYAGQRETEQTQRNSRRGRDLLSYFSQR